VIDRFGQRHPWFNNKTDAQLAVEAKKLLNSGEIKETWLEEQARKHMQKLREQFEDEQRTWMEPYEDGVEGVSAKTETLLRTYVKNTSDLLMFDGMGPIISHVRTKLDRLTTRRVGYVFGSVNRRHFSLSPIFAFSNLGSIFGGAGELSSPWVHAEVIDRLQHLVVPGSRVLLVSSGTGYMACLLGLMVRGQDGTPNGQVVIVEDDKDTKETARYNIQKTNEQLLDDNVIVFSDPDETMYLGKDEEGPFDAIYVSQPPGSDLKFDFAFTLMRQLKDPNGVMLIPKWGSQHVGSDRDQDKDDGADKDDDEEDDDDADGREQEDDDPPPLEHFVPKEKQPRGYVDDYEELERLRSDWAGVDKDMKTRIKPLKPEALRETHLGYNLTKNRVSAYHRKLKAWQDKIDEKNMKKARKRDKQRQKRLKKIERKTRGETNERANRKADGEPVEGRVYFVQYEDAMRQLGEEPLYPGLSSKCRRQVSWEVYRKTYLPLALRHETALNES